MVSRTKSVGFFIAQIQQKGSGFMGKRKTYEVESMEDLRQMIEELPDGVILEVSVKQGGDEDEL